MEVKRRTDRSLVQWLNSDFEQIRTQAICELRLLSKHDPDSRAYISEAGAIHLLLHLLYGRPREHHRHPSQPLHLRPGAPHGDARPSRCPPPPFPRSLRPERLRHPLQPHHRPGLPPIIGAKPQIVFTLVDLLRIHSSPTRSIKDALKALFGIALYPLNRPRIIDLGAIPALFSLALKDGGIEIMEDACLLVLVVEPGGENYGGCVKTSFASFWKRQSIKSTDQLNSLCFQDEFGPVF